jgi:uracil-DNA glycosylase family 4
MKLLKSEIKSVSPDVVLALGKQPAKYIAGRDGNMKSFRNKDIGVSFSESVFKLNVAYHPAATLYEPSLYDEFVNDLEYATQDIENIYSDQNYLSDF